MLKLIKIGYTTSSGVSRRANILSTSEEDAINFLRKVTKNNISTINDVGMDADVHAYSDESLAYIKKKTPEAAKTSNPQTVEPQKVYVCPWCEKEFEKTTGLKIHIQKSHKKEE